MKSYLEFDMASPDDREQHAEMLKAQDLFSVVRDFDNYLRGQLKYHDDDYTEAELQVFREVRQTLFDHLAARGIELW